jgi:hypothetical protein
MAGDDVVGAGLLLAVLDEVVIHVGAGGGPKGRSAAIYISPPNRTSRMAMNRAIAHYSFSS